MLPAKLTRRFLARTYCRSHGTFADVQELRSKYYSMAFEEQQEYLIRKLRDFTDPESNRIDYYYEKVRHRPVGHPVYLADSADASRAPAAMFLVAPPRRTSGVSGR
jgi:hypothetical protein